MALKMPLPTQGEAVLVKDFGLWGPADLFIIEPNSGIQSKRKPT